MNNSKVLLSFFLFFFSISFASSSSFNNSTHKCRAQQRHSLLLFKEDLLSTSQSPGKGSYVDLACHGWLGSGYYPIMTNWKTSTDCCNWGGITCDHFTGDVIGIDLSCGMLRGTIHPNTTLFHLPYLQRLNLAFNDFTASQLPHEIGRFSNSLTHLNISFCGFTGQVPMDITLLHNLVSLDLSWNMYDFNLEPHVLNILLGNFTVLRELSIQGVNIFFVLPTYLNISSSLKMLSLRSTRLQGKLPNNIFNLQYLELLDLSDNHDITGPLPKVNISTNIPLKSLDLSGIPLVGDIHDSIGHLKSLNYLHLSSCGLVGFLPKSLVNLRQLISLDLSFNFLNGTLPSWLFTIPSLQYINLIANMFSGSLPSEMFNHRSLKWLLLANNQFVGEVNLIDEELNSQSFLNLANLAYLDLSFNSFSGVWEMDSLLSSLKNLEVLMLSYSGLSIVSSPYNYYVNLDIQTLGLAFCKLTIFPESLRAMKNLRQLDLSNNLIQGNIPYWVEEIGEHTLQYLNLSRNSLIGMHQFQWDELTTLDLHLNQFEGPFPVSICNLTSLRYLDMSNNNFVGLIPRCLGNIGSSIMHLDVKSNLIKGPFPSSICNMSNLQFLDMSNNNFDGLIPQCLGNIGSSILYLNVKSNLFEGPFPSSICNLSRLQLLDMSNNSFVGVITHCMRNISSSILIINLGNNYFCGTIPDVYNNCGRLEWFILNKNNFEGEVPNSLSKCQYLKVLDLGNNHLNGTFPGWLADFPKLQVVVLKSNNLHGPFETTSTTELQFPSLRVLDLSSNGFVGFLPAKHFHNFNAMKDIIQKGRKPEYLNMGNQYYCITIAVKDSQLYFPRLSIDYIIVDLSRNRFEGEIPNVIGSLNSLKVLNLSHNNLNGQIPSALGNLSMIESLDLSWNKLVGEIPQSLADITTLEVLNLSHNHLVGRIPEGRQFGTFEGNSFEGNLGLCGLLMHKQCEDPSSLQLIEGDGITEKNGFTWKLVMLGYVCGTLLGLAMGYFMLSTGRPKWFNVIVDA